MSHATVDPHTDAQHGNNYSVGYIATLVLAVVLAIFGILILGGGVWLIGLGGSWYYAIAGAGLCLTAWYLARPSINALWVYLAVYAFTVVWALWEKGLEGWAQVPRLVAPTVILVLILAALPVLRHSGRTGTKTRSEREVT